MSSRAVRKAQREAEQQEHLDQLNKENIIGYEMPSRQTRSSLFSTLQEDHELSEDVESADSDSRELVGLDNAEQASSNTYLTTGGSETPSNPRRKKKRKSKKKQITAETDTTSTAANDVESNLLLNSLSISAVNAHLGASEPSSQSSELRGIQQLLCVDTQNLNADNEVRRLFGRVSDDANQMEGETPGGRRRQKGRHGNDRGLASLGMRQNLFIKAKDQWPRSTGGGLGMEVEETTADDTVWYRFVHNRQYQDAQRQFSICVASMDPERMIQQLLYNPYHISTLLQVSEIAKSERDHATSGDLIERALFSFGRSVHSSFAKNLKEGKARLDFRRPENRELWLAASRYITNLGMRATWRTAFEWAKLLLSLGPLLDPYCIRLVFDQLALRARQAHQLVEFAENDFFESKWKNLPNIRISLGLAYVYLKNPQKGKATLSAAIKEFPWVIARLFKELNIDQIPPLIWGKQPRTEEELLMSEHYALRAKDIWNTPEATSLLVEVAFTVTDVSEDTSVSEGGISEDLARYVALTEVPSLISLVPPALLSRLSSSSDPLPPQHNKVSYQV